MRLEAKGLTLRVTAPAAQIEAVAGSDALLRSQVGQLGEVADQLDRGQITPDAARALCALAATEASKQADSLAAMDSRLSRTDQPGSGGWRGCGHPPRHRPSTPRPRAGDNELCAALIAQLRALARMQATLPTAPPSTYRPVPAWPAAPRSRGFWEFWEDVGGCDFDFWG